MNDLVKTAVIPVAGNGSRIRPLSLVTPKEMLATPFGPIIELIANELIDAGIERIIFVTKPGKELIEAHLRKTELHQPVPGKKVSLEFINQNNIPGNGGAILSAVDICQITEPFMVVWGDEIFINNDSPNRAAELIKTYNNVQSPCIVLTSVGKEHIPKCGMARTFPEASGKNLVRITDLVEKPQTWLEKERYASVGGYIITPEIVEKLKNAKKSQDGEIYLSQAISDYLNEGNRLYGVLTECEWHETGSIEGYISAFEALAKMRKGILET